jgi:hypothetical protein
VLDLADSSETSTAAPPAFVYSVRGTGIPPLLVTLVAPAQEIFLVIGSEVVAEVVLAKERGLVTTAPLVVAEILRLLVLLLVPDFIVPLEVGRPAGSRPTTWITALVPLLLCG